MNIYMYVYILSYVRTRARTHTRTYAREHIRAQIPTDWKQKNANRRHGHWRLAILRKGIRTYIFTNIYTYT